MSEKSKNTEVKIALPAKEYFTLDEVAEKWTQLSGAKIDTDHLMQLGMDGILTMCVLADAWFVDKLSPPTRNETSPPSRERLDGFVELYPQTIKDLFLKESAEVNWIKSCQGYARCDVGTLSNQRSNVLSSQKLWIDDENSPDLFLPLIHRKNLLISLVEIKRLEQENRIIEPVENLDASENNSEETENKKLKRALAAIVLGLSKTAKYKIGDKPNISRIVELALEGVSDPNGSVKFGYGKNTIRDAINIALEFAQTEFE